MARAEHGLAQLPPGLRSLQLISSRPTRTWKALAAHLAAATPAPAPWHTPATGAAAWPPSPWDAPKPSLGAQDHGRSAEGWESAAAGGAAAEVWLEGPLGDAWWRPASPPSPPVAAAAGSGRWGGPAAAGAAHQHLHGRAPAAPAGGRAGGRGSGGGGGGGGGAAAGAARPPDAGPALAVLGALRGLKLRSSCPERPSPEELRTRQEVEGGDGEVPDSPEEVSARAAGYFLTVMHEGAALGALVAEGHRGRSVNPQRPPLSVVLEHGMGREGPSFARRDRMALLVVVLCALALAAG